MKSCRMYIGQIPLYGDDNVLTKLFDIRGEGGEINNPLSSKDVSDTDFGNRNVIKNLFSIGAWGSEESSEGNMLKVKMLNHPERGHQGRAEAHQHQYHLLRPQRRGGEARDLGRRGRGGGHRAGS